MEDPDLEKAPHHSALPASSSSDSTSLQDGSPLTGPIKGSGPRTSISRRSTATAHSLDAEDLYENLEHVITPDQETAAERQAREPITYTRSGVSVTSSAATRPSEFEVIFEEGDPENPRNWSLWYRVWILGCVSFATWVIVLYSTSYTSSTPGLMLQFNISSTVATLGMTTYLMGLAVGSLILAPMSELYGRQKVYIICLCIWAVLIIPCGLANSLTTILVVRFFG